MRLSLRLTTAGKEISLFEKESEYTVPNFFLDSSNAHLDLGILPPIVKSISPQLASQEGSNLRFIILFENKPTTGYINLPWVHSFVLIRKYNDYFYIEKLGIYLSQTLLTNMDHVFWHPSFVNSKIDLYKNVIDDAYCVKHFGKKKNQKQHFDLFNMELAPEAMCDAFKDVNSLLNHVSKMLANLQFTEEIPQQGDYDNLLTEEMFSHFKPGFLFSDYLKSLAQYTKPSQFNFGSLLASAYDEKVEVVPPAPEVSFQAKKRKDANGVWRDANGRFTSPPTMGLPETELLKRFHSKLITELNNNPFSTNGSEYITFQSSNTSNIKITAV